MINAKITGVGGYVPEKVYDNAYMESIVDTNDEWITRRTGIKERHISADNEYTTDMATIAAKRAIENAGLTPEDIDLIMLATVTPDYFTPAWCLCCTKQSWRGKCGWHLTIMRLVSGLLQVYYRRTVYKSRNIQAYRCSMCRHIKQGYRL